MSDSIIDKEFIHYFTLLDEKQKEALLALIKSYINPDGSPVTERMTIEQYNKELDEGNEQIDKGEFITAEELKKEAQNW